MPVGRASGSGVVKTSSVGRFGRWRRPSRVVKSPAPPDARPGTARPSARCRARAARSRRTGARSAPRPSASAAPIRSSHAAAGSGSSSRRTCQSSSRAARTRPLVELRIDELRPGRVRARDDRPVRRALADDARRLLEPRQLVAAEQRRVDAREDVRGDDAGERDARVAALGERLEPVAVPRRHELERLRVGVLDPRALDERVEVRDVDEERAALVRRRRRPRARAPPGRSWRRRRAIWPGCTFAPWTASSARASKRSSTAGDRSVSANSTRVDARAGDRPLPRVAAGISDATRRAYRADLRDFAEWYGDGGRSSDVDVRVLADYTADLGRARPGGKLAPATIARRLAAVRGAAAVLARAATRVPDASLAPRRPRRLPDAPKLDRGRGAARRRSARRAARSRSATARSSSSSTRPGCAAPRPSASTSATSTSSRSASTSATARARKDRVVPLGEEAAHWVARYLREARPAARARRRERALPLGARPAARHLDAAPPHPAPAPPPARVRDAPARGRRRPARDPGAARPLVALDDADLQPRRREAAPPCLRPSAPAILTGRGVPRAARGAARAADRRRLPARPRRARARTSASRSRSASVEDLERYIAQLRADGLSPATIARRTAAARTFFRHQQLIGARGDNPAAGVELPRRDAHAAADALAGRGRAADRRRERASRRARCATARSSSCSTAPACASPRRSGSRRAASTSTTGSCACIGKGGKERVVPVGREAVEALRRYLARGRPYLDRRHRPELFLNAKGGALTRAARS